ncbi:MAG: lytic murein transglycosylase [Sphingomonadales bacterium]|mgnify:CR=1 FL=1|jgi:membrane-bound lytic murein transglycosylase B|uniref:lytic murein transglycosylase n=3 Tax=Sphingorhabdus sp. TaxID=1902408 RepID=UPI003BB0E44C|nr:lytic murein transglycosylase [Sphingomonadales bacterium]MBK9431705.1 lytic murein transglycosylase [Sphingomonadales bacterium]
MKIGATFSGFLATGLLALSAPPAAVIAQSSEPAGFRDYLQTVRNRAASEGVTQATLDRVMPGLTYNARVVQLDRAQPEGDPNAPIPKFDPYRRKHVDAARIGRGRTKYTELRPLLGRIERETGVPEEVMLAIYGHETNYGTVTGNYNAPQALASLAFEGRRRPLFEGELIAVLKMIDRGVPQYAITGSWAGALGKPQFLPSVYLRLARDGDGDGYADIWNSEVDAMTSIANYLLNAGWRRDEPWGFAVNVPASLDRNAIRSNLVPNRCARVFSRHSRWMSIGEWRKMGFSIQSGVWPQDSMMATLIEPDGEGATGYLLGSNYRAILDYNCSNFYALSVGLLADAVRN